MRVGYPLSISIILLISTTFAILKGTSLSGKEAIQRLLSANRPNPGVTGRQSTLVTSRPTQLDRLVRLKSIWLSRGSNSSAGRLGPSLLILGGRMVQLWFLGIR